MKRVIRGRAIKGGRARGRALCSPEPIGFLGGVDPESGCISEKGHPLEGQSIASRVLVFPHGKGSTVGSYVIYRMARQGTAPAGMILTECEPIVAIGAIMAEIPVVDLVDISAITDGGLTTIDGDKIIVE